MTYGSDEYKEALKGMSEGLKNHYESNRHHPEHFENGIEGMSLIDLIEMICDWEAARQRNNGNLEEGLKVCAERFNIDKQLMSIIYNTIKEMGWDKE